MDEDKKIKLGCFISFVVVLVLVLSLFHYFLNRPAPVYETNDVANYGIIKGNYNNDKPKKYIFSFFPEKIEEYFCDVTYHYKAEKSGAYAFEMYLEFEIQDADKYASFVSNVIGDGACEPFHFDPAYQAYYISNYITLDQFLMKDDPNYSESDPYFIDNAQVGLMLFSEEEQRVVFFALGMYESTYLEDFSFFFNRFEIDPLEYEKKATPGYITLN